MRIVAIGEFEVGSHRAHAINVVKTAGGFARLGHEATVVCRSEWGDAGSARMNPGELYGEPSLRWMCDGPEGQRAHAQWAAEVAMSIRADVVYARSFAAGLRCAEVGLATVMETHAYIGDANPQLIAAFEATAREEHPLRGIVTISPRLAEHYRSRGAQRVHVVPDGVDVELFSPPDGAAGGGGREVGAASAVYAGHLYDYKGVPTMLDAAALLPEVTFELVGGTEEDQARVRQRAAAVSLRNVVVHGAVGHTRVPPYLWRADVLLLPPSAQEPSAAWTSPVKLGEYLASGRPIVASRIPGLESWVDEPAVRWFCADDAVDLARAIRLALRETAGEREVRAAHARALAERYSYPARASAILRAAARCPAASGPGVVGAI